MEVELSRGYLRNRIDSEDVNLERGRIEDITLITSISILSTSRSALGRK